MKRPLSALLIATLLSPSCARKDAAAPNVGARDMAEERAVNGSGLAAAPEMAKLEAKATEKGDAGGKQGGADDKPAETWKRSTVVANATRLAIGDHEELAQRAMHSRVEIDGYRARVVIDYLYANDTDRQLEGTFQLRLPEDATPYFFAFGESAYSTPELKIAAQQGVDPDQIMMQRKSEWVSPREARMVPRETAAYAYTQTERRRVDPALVEWAGAGVFSARVFPLAAHKLHRIVVGYDVDLTRIGDDLEYHFDLPAKTAAPVVDISVNEPDGLAVATTPAATAHDGLGHKLFHFEHVNDPTIAVRVRGVAGSTITGHDAAGTFFAAQARVALPEAAAAGSDTAVFAVDTSLSSNPDRFNVFLALLRGVLDNNRGSLKRFAVLFFSVDAHWYKPMFLDNTKANVDALIAYANTLALEGATDLGAAFAQVAQPAWLPAQAEKSAPPYDVFLLSDGAATWGEANLHALVRTLASGRAGSVFAYRTGLAGTDNAALAEITRETGGAVFSVTGESEIAKASTAHRTRPWRLVDASIEGGSDIMLAGRPRTLFPGQTLVAVGRGTLAAHPVLALTVERDGKRTTIKAPLGGSVESPLAPRAYGQVATDELEELEASAATTAKAYATHFRITGRTCSLLMLESEADYQRFGIVPEHDTELVAQTPAGALFGKTMAQVAETLGDPKAAFLAFLEKLEKSPNIGMRIPPEYRTAIERMPAAAFVVPTEPLATKLPLASLLPQGMVARLRSHDLDYDAISADAEARKKLAGAADALKGLSSLVEENPGDAVLARDVAFSAMDLGLDAQAYHLLRRVAEIRPYEPQTYRVMAQALADMGKLDLALAYYEIPLMASWEPRFGDLHAIVELDYLRFLRTSAQDQRLDVGAYASQRAGELASKIGIKHADIVTTITWNTDNTDVDLHVTEPSGEECFYGHRSTATGGELTQDVTQGYGPEMYVLAKAPHGAFKVRAHYFASDRNRASVRTKVYVRTFEDWGTPRERVTDKVVALEVGKEFHDIATLQR